MPSKQNLPVQVSVHPTRVCTLNKALPGSSQLRPQLATHSAAFTPCDSDLPSLSGWPFQIDHPLGDLLPPA